MSDDDELVTPRHFAERLGFSADYGSQLKRDGRLVMAADGKHALLRASMRLYESTKDPRRQGVADRHAAERAAASGNKEAAAGGDKIGSTYQAARAVKERFLALEAKRAYEEAIGQLRDAREVESLAVAAGADLRQRMDSLAVSLAPLLLGQTDEVAVREILQEHFHDALASAAHNFKRLSKVEK